MTRQATERYPELQRLLDDLQSGMGPVLRSVVLYGPAAHDDLGKNSKNLHVLLVCEDLELSTLERAGSAIRHWLKRGYPMPRFFSPQLIASAADVFPADFLRIASHHVLLHGDSPFAQLEIDTDNLRMQCERELREKLMRFREAYIEAGGKERRLRQLLEVSYLDFAEVFRGCLLVLKAELPTHNRDVAQTLCRHLGIESDALVSAEELANESDRSTPELGELVNRYYRTLGRLVDAMDKYAPKENQL